MKSGESLNHYRLVEKIGEGGMGVVWKAEDTKLSRMVAIKILPTELAGDPQRLGRFEREAKLLATLNHPNVAGIHGLEEAEGIRFLVLELVDGLSLSQMLKTRPLPVDDALDICRQIAEGLEAAHDAGVIHRDLKPGNVVVSEEGQAKVLDFGLAKGADGGAAGDSGSDLSMSPTMTVGATQAGIVLGTAPYMSPEQARGKKLDKRTDVWSFGCLLYECLTAKMAFGGETISDTISLILQREPDVAALPGDVPDPVRKLLGRCLEKDPRKRLRDIGEARIVLGNVLAGAGTGSGPAGRAGLHPTMAPESAAGDHVSAASSGRWIWILGGILIGAALLAGVERWLAPMNGPTDTRVRRFALELPNLVGSYEQAPVLSPDGRRIAYFAETRLWVRDLERLEPVLISEAQDNATPFWSPDSRAIAFERDGKLMRAEPGKGEPSVITFLPPYDLEAGAWGPDDRIYLVFGSNDLYVVPAQGGDPRVLIKRDPATENDFHTPSVLPDGESLVYTLHHEAGRDTLEVFTGGVRKQILRIEGARIEFARYAPSGHLVFHRLESHTGIWAVPFSAGSLEITGEPFLVVPDGQFPSVSADGSLLYFKGNSSSLRELVWIDRQGNVSEPLGDPLPSMEYPQISPDGKSVLVSALEEGNQDIWRYEIDSGAWTRLTFDESNEYHAAFSRDGSKMVYVSRASGRPNIVVRDLDGSFTPTQVAPGWAPQLSPDGNSIVFARLGKETGPDVWMIDLSSGKETLLAGHEMVDGDTQISPDGRFMLYESEVSPNKYQVFVRPFPEGDGLWQVSIRAGGWGEWSTGQDEIFYVTNRAEGDSLVSRSIESLNPPRFGQEVTLFNDWEIPGISFFTRDKPYDVAPDGKRFVFVRTVEENDGEKPSLVFTENWFEDYRSPGR